MFDTFWLTILGCTLNYTHFDPYKSKVCTLKADEEWAQSRVLFQQNDSDEILPSTWPYCFRLWWCIKMSTCVYCCFCQSANKYCCNHQKIRMALRIQDKQTSTHRRLFGIWCVGDRKHLIKILLWNLTQRMFWGAVSLQWELTLINE